MSTRGKEFISLVRSTPITCDSQLEELFDKINSNSFNRGFEKSWFLSTRLREFGRRVSRKFDEDMGYYRENLVRLGWSGEYLEKKAQQLYSEEQDPQEFIKTALGKRSKK